MSSCITLVTRTVLFKIEQLQSYNMHVVKCKICILICLFKAEGKFCNTSMILFYIFPCGLLRSTNILQQSPVLVGPLTIIPLSCKKHRKLLNKSSKGEAEEIIHWLWRLCVKKKVWSLGGDWKSWCFRTESKKQRHADVSETLFSLYIEKLPEEEKNPLNTHGGCRHHSHMTQLLLHPCCILTSTSCVSNIRHYRWTHC